jgi:aryl-alcohol dehydrogenase-like predicted oxidoreductase
VKQRPLGFDAPVVSAVGYGGMHLSITDARPPEAESIAVIHAALDAGVTLIDTADVYSFDHTDIGHNERLIAKALATWRGDPGSVVVATKGGLVRPDARWERDARPVQLRQAVERSLHALGVEQLALYQLHAPDPNVPLAESVGELERLRGEGKIRWVGLSNVSVAEIRAARAIVPITTVQNRLNPFFREALTDGVVRYCAEQGIGFLAYSPTGGGRLTRKLPSHPVLAAIAARHRVSAHAVVLAWALAQSPAVIVIPSARTVAHALDSVGAANLQLAPSDIAAIDAAEFSRA